MIKKFISPDFNVGIKNINTFSAYFHSTEISKIMKFNDRQKMRLEGSFYNR